MAGRAVGLGCWPGLDDHGATIPTRRMVGGGSLAGQFYDAGLLNEIIVQVGSVTLSKGKPLFPRPLTSPPLKLISVRQVGTGFAELRDQIPTTNRSQSAV